MEFVSNILNNNNIMNYLIVGAIGVAVGASITYITKSYVDGNNHTNSNISNLNNNKIGNNGELLEVMETQEKLVDKVDNNEELLEVVETQEKLTGVSKPKFLNRDMDIIHEINDLDLNKDEIIDIFCTVKNVSTFLGRDILFCQLFNDHPPEHLNIILSLLCLHGGSLIIRAFTDVVLNPVEKDEIYDKVIVTDNHKKTIESYLTHNMGTDNLISNDYIIDDFFYFYNLEQLARGTDMFF